jgi:hypothetical protein
VSIWNGWDTRQADLATRRGCPPSTPLPASCSDHAFLKSLTRTLAVCSPRREAKGRARQDTHGTIIKVEETGCFPVPPPGSPASRTSSLIVGLGSKTETLGGA